MPFLVNIDSRKIINFAWTSPSNSTNASIAVSNPTGKLVFTVTPQTGSVETVELLTTSFAGMIVPTGVLITLEASLANGKAFSGDGTVVAQARVSGEDLKGFNISTDRIQLSDGSAYSLTAEQALISQIGATGALADLRSTNSNSKMTVWASTGSNLTAIQLDRFDLLNLTAGQSYTLTGEQALIAKVGAGAPGDLTACGPLLIRASQSLDLSAIKIDTSDVIELGLGQDYVLTSNLVALARVGATGTSGQLTAAGAITVKSVASTTISEDWSSIKATGVDVYELTAGRAYTLTADQLTMARVGPNGLLGNTAGSGQLTIKAGLVNDLSKLPTKLVLDSKGVIDLLKSDIIVLDVGVDYRLNSDQAKVAKVGTGSTVKAGDLTLAGEVTVVAGSNANNTGVFRAEDLSNFVSKGVNFFELFPGADYVLTTAQAMWAKVGPSGNYANLQAAGNITLIAQASEDLTLSTIVGADEFRLTPGQTYKLSAEQALKSRVMGSTGLGAYGDVSGTKSMVVAGAMNNLTKIAIDANDAIALTAGLDYTLTSLQASVAKIDDSPVGALAKARLVTIVAAAKDEKLSTTLATVTGYDEILLTAGGKYALSSEQAKVSRVIVGSGTLSSLSDLALTGQVTLIANAAGEDLSQLTVQGIKSVQLTAGKDYTLTAAQALIARIGDAGVAADLVGPASSTTTTTTSTSTSTSTGTTSSGTGATSTTTAGSTSTTSSSTTTTSKTGVITVKDAPNGFDFTKIKTDGNDVLVLTPGSNYRLNTAQATTAKMSVDGLAGQLVSSGAITVVSSTDKDDLTKLTLDSGDTMELLGGLSYTLNSEHLSLVRIGGVNSLTKANQVVVVVNAADGDISGFNVPGVDVYQLTPGVSYTLRMDQASIARVGPTGLIGDLSAAGEIKLRAPDSLTTPMDLTGVVLKATDNLQLIAGSSYIITDKQAAMATVFTAPNTISARGDLLTATEIIVRPAPGADLSTQLTDVSGVDRIELDPHAAYTLTDTQARIAGFGKSGPARELSSTSAKGTLTVVAGDDPYLTDIRLDNNDKVILQSDKLYNLTFEQASIAQFLGGAPGVLTSNDPASIIRVRAMSTADITKVQLDAGDQVLLGLNQRYTLTSSQARIAWVYDSDPATGVGNFSNAGAIRIIAVPAGEDLSDLIFDANDTIQLSQGANYTLTAAQAAIATLGATGAKGKLQGPGVITVKAGATADLTGLSLDTTAPIIILPPATVPAGDVIQLEPGQNYTLTTSQAAIAKVGASGTMGQLSGAGQLTLIANPQGEDLSLSLANVSGLDAQDRIVLARTKSYFLNKDQMAITQVGSSGMVGDLTAAGTITLKSTPAGATEDLSTLSGITGLDKIWLKSGVNTTLTPAQAMLGQFGSGKVQDLRGTEIITLKANSQDSDLSSVLTDNSNDLIWLANNKSYVFNSSQVPRITYDGQTLPAPTNVTGLFTLKANTTGEDISAINTTAIDLIQLTLGRNYTMTPEQARIATLGNTLTPQSTVKTYSGSGTLFSTPVGTQNYTTQVTIDTTGYLSGGTILMQIVLGSGATAASYDLYKNNITVDSTSGRPLYSLANAYDVAPGTTTNLTYQFSGSSTDKYILGIEGNWFSTPNYSNNFTYQITVLGQQYIQDLTKAGVITIQASPDGDPGLKSKLSGISGIDTILLTDTKNYTLSAAQAAIAKIGTGSAGTLTSTGIIAVDDSNSAAGTKQDLTKLVLDTNDTLTLGAGDYQLNSAQVIKASTSLAGAGVVNLWGNASLGENLFGISATNLDNIYLSASKDYTLGLDQVAKAKVGATGLAGNLTKAGNVTLKLTDGQSTSTLGSNMKGIDVLQLLAIDTGQAGISYTLSAGLTTKLQVVFDATSNPMRFSKNLTGTTTGSGYTGSDSLVNDIGEWTFVNSTDVLTYWNGSSAQAITLIGVASVSADGSSMLKIGF